MCIWPVNFYTYKLFYVLIYSVIFKYILGSLLEYPCYFCIMNAVEIAYKLKRSMNESATAARK